MACGGSNGPEHDGRTTSGSWICARSSSAGAWARRRAERLPAPASKTAGAACRGRRLTHASAALARRLDRLLVEVPIGATPETFVDAADQIANAARSEECRVRVDSPGRVWIEIRRRDLLAKVVPSHRCLPIGWPSSITACSSAFAMTACRGGCPFSTSIVSSRALPLGEGITSVGRDHRSRSCCRGRLRRARRHRSQGRHGASDRP